MQRAVSYWEVWILHTLQVFEATAKFGLFEISIQLYHRYADPCFPKIWMQNSSTPLKQWLWEEFQQQQLVNSTLSLDSAKHLTVSLAWNVYNDFLD